MRYHFPPFELDDETLTLKKQGELVAIRPQALEVLLHLVRCRDRFVTREELVRDVWGGASVSDTAVPQAILAARRAIGDAGDEAVSVQTIRGRGYRFIADVRVDRPAAGAEGGHPGRFVGREAAVRRLEKALASAGDGRGDVVLLVGAPGYGKSRAAAELSAVARRTALVVETACRAGGSELGPWMDVIRTLGGDEASVFPSTSPEARPPAPTELAVVEHVAGVLRTASSKAPLVVVIDDLHFADESSILLFRLLGDSLRNSRVVFVATYEDAALTAHPVLARTVAGLVRQDPSRCVPLRPLTADEVADLASSLFGANVSAEGMRRVFEKSDGSPLLATQLLFLVCSEDWLSAPGDVATSAMLSTNTVREAIGLHLEELSTGCRRALAAASIFGRVFTLTDLTQTLEADRASTLSLLDEALRARVVEKRTTSPGGFRFVHSLVRDILYKELSLTDRARLHERAGRALAASGEEPMAAEQLARAADALGLSLEGPSAPGARVQALLARLDECRAR
ncbi:MAG TPA: AAA family ATPase [Polyangiaceae bacterium]|nr:AAA family ATPase [Polyangiaceae bacterium]